MDAAASQGNGVIPVGWDILAAACAAVAVGALIQSVAGYGLGLLSGPMLAALDPVLVPAPVLLVTVVLGLFIMLRERGAVAWRQVGMATLGRLSGAIGAAALLASVNLALFYVVFGIMVLAGVGLSVAGWRARLNDRNLVAAGIGSGIMGTFASIGAPPILLLYQGADMVRARGTLAVFFGCGALMSVAALAGFGQVARDDFVLAGLLLPSIVVGFALAGPVSRAVDRRVLRWFALGASTLVAVYLVVRGVLTLVSS
ncbi:MAG: sulfite exporter TauE/SafE family protein [Alphaproteobacteria bacterium]